MRNYSRRSAISLITAGFTALAQWRAFGATSAKPTPKPVKKSPAPKSKPKVTAKPSPSPILTKKPLPSKSPTFAPLPSAKPTPSASATPTAKPTPSPTASISESAKPSPSASVTESAKPSASATPSQTQSASPTPSPSKSEAKDSAAFVEKDDGSVGVALLLENLPVGSSVNAVFNNPATSGFDEIVVHRSSESTVVAYTAICTHQGCTVAASAKTYDCPCHGSMYDSATGKVLRGPAPRSLAPIPVIIKDGALFITH